MAEIVGLIDEQTLRDRLEQTRRQAEVGKVRAIHDERRAREWARRRAERKVQSGKFNQIKKKEA